MNEHPRSSRRNPALEPQRAARLRYGPRVGMMPTEMEDTQSADNESTRSPLIDLFPETETLRCGFNAIDVPAATIGTGVHGWYGLLDMRVGEEIGDELALFGLTFDAVSTDHTPAALNRPWGTTAGTGAAIFVSDNLPITVGEWTEGPCVHPGISGDEITNEIGRYWWVGEFPGGNFSDDPPFKVRDNKSWSPYTFRIPKGRKVQVGLCINKTQIDAAAASGKKFDGFAAIQLNVGLTRNARLFTGQR